jgi:xanthine dehydrogenase accessory factor
VISPATSRRAQELTAEGAAFVIATVVRAQRPTSVEAGNVALVLADGAIEGFVGGVCTEHSIRAYSLSAMQTGEAVLLRILPFTEEGDPGYTGAVADADGAVTVQNPCLSGGAIEVFLEPSLPAPRVVVIGETPIAVAVREIGAQLGLEVGAGAEPSPADFALVVAGHGRDELHALRLGLDAELPYVGLVASRKRGAGVLDELRADGVPDEQLDRIDVPAGIEIGARTPGEVALSILAKIVAVRRQAMPGSQVPTLKGGTAVPGSHGNASRTAALAVDPICGMTVAAVDSTLHVQHDGETVYFCREACRDTFLTEHSHAA